MTLPISLPKQAESGTPVVDETDPNLLLGALEIGMFVSTFLFGVLMTQGWLYWRQRKRDKRTFQVLVVLSLILEFLHTIACMGAVYYFTVTTAGISDKPGNCYSFTVALAFGSLAIALVQTFYVFRCYTFSSNLTLSLIGYLLVVLHVSGSLWITYESWLGVTDLNPFKVQMDFGWLISVTLAAAVLVDVYVAGSMCWYLKRSLDGIQMFESTTSLVKRLLVWTIETGLATSVASITVLVCFQVMKFNYIWTAIYLSLTKLYSISFLLSLNQRPINRTRYGVGDPTCTSIPHFRSQVSSYTSNSSRPVSPSQDRLPRRWTDARLVGAVIRRTTVT